MYNSLEGIFESIQRGRLDDFVRLVEEAEDLHQGLATVDNCVFDYIIVHDRHEFLDVLLSKFPTLLLSRTEKQQTCLHLAVANPSLRILDLLLARQHDHKDFLNATNQWNETCLHVAAGIGNVDIVRKLVVAGVDQSLGDKWGRTAGDLARQNGNRALLAENLLDTFHSSSTNVEERTIHNEPIVKQQVVVNEFMTALSSLKARRRPDDHSAVLVKGIFSQMQDKISFHEPNDVDSQQPNITINPHPTMAIPVVAVPMQKKVALSKILEYPGDLQAVQKALDDHDINGKDMFGLTALHKLASWDVVDILEYLLQQPEVDVNVVVKAAGPQCGFTALHCAIDTNAMRAVEMLAADSRVDLTVKDQRNRTVLDLAKEKQLPEDLLQLLRR